MVEEVEEEEHRQGKRKIIVKCLLFTDYLLLLLH